MTEIEPVSFFRATPPEVAALGQSIRSALTETDTSCEEYAALFRQHRFDGTAVDKQAAAQWLGQRFASPPPLDRIIVTNGTMNSILLLMATMIGANGVLATEAMTFPQVRTIASLFNIRLKGVALDAEGVRPDAFEVLCRSRERPTALYCNPTLQSPTAALMSAARRREIAAVAQRHGVLIIEDEAQALYANDPPPPIASIAPECTWYLMGLSKYLSLGIRMGFVLAPSAAAAQAMLARTRTLSTWHAAPIVAKLVTGWIRDETAHRLFRAARAEIHARQAIVREVFQDLPQFRGTTGLHFWLGAPAGCSAEQFVRTAEAHGVLVRSSDLYAVDEQPATPGVRPAIGDPPSRERVAEGLRRLRSAFDALDSSKTAN